MPPPGYRDAGIAWTGASGTRCVHRTFGLGFEHDGTLMLAFRGTQDIADFIADLHGREAAFALDGAQRFPSPLRGVDGFEAVYRSMREALRTIVADARPARLHLAGHSLGAALATYLCVDLSIDARPFASPIALTSWAPPKPGNQALADVLRAQLRLGRLTAEALVNIHDIVPKYPFSLEDIHPFEPRLLDFGNPFDVLGNHRLAHYLQAFERGWFHRPPIASTRYEEHTA